MNLTITAKKGKIIRCRIFNTATGKWYTGNNWSPVDTDALYTDLLPIALSNEYEDRYVGQVEIPVGGPYIVEYIDSSTGVVIGEEHTDDPNAKIGYSLVAEYDPAKTAATQASVNAIPTNTLLTNDARLNNLDARVSSRSTYNGGPVASVIAPVTVGVNNDKTGYSSDLVIPQGQIDAINEARDASVLARKLQSNKAIISEDGSTVTIYDDDQETVLYVFAISLDQKTRVPV